MVHSIVYGQRPSAHAANPLLPATIDVPLGRAMAALPENRFANCTEFVSALDTALRATVPVAAHHRRFLLPAALAADDPPGGVAVLALAGRQATDSGLNCETSRGIRRRRCGLRPAVQV